MNKSKSSKVITSKDQLFTYAYLYNCYPILKLEVTGWSPITIEPVLLDNGESIYSKESWETINEFIHLGWDIC